MVVAQAAVGCRRRANRLHLHPLHLLRRRKDGSRPRPDTPLPVIVRRPLPKEGPDCFLAATGLRRRSLSRAGKPRPPRAETVSETMRKQAVAEPVLDSPPPPGLAGLRWRLRLLYHGHSLTAV